MSFASLLGLSLDEALVQLRASGLAWRVKVTGVVRPEQPARVVRVDRNDNDFELTVVYAPRLRLE